MYINNLIYLLAANYHENPISNDESYQIISIISKYQQPIHNYKFDNVTNPQLYTTVEEVFYNLINAAQRDITVLSYKHPEFSNYENFPIINRLVQYIADLYLIENTSSLIGYRYIENYENIHKNIKSTIQNGLKEIFNRAWDDADPAFPKTASQYITYEDADNTIPVSTIGQYGLPMTGVRGASDIFTDQGNGETHHDYNNMLYEDIDESPIDLTSVSSLSLEIPLVRCVSKVVVKVTNAMNKDLNIYSVRFGRFFANKVYYYAHDPLHMPGETNLANWIFRFAKNSPIQLTSGTEDQTVFIGYIYPTSLPREEVTNPPYRYSIALESNVNATSTYTVFLSKDQNAETTDIGRNKLVVIDCTVNVHSMQIDELQLIVLPWDEADENNIIFD